MTADASNCVQQQIATCFSTVEPATGEVDNDCFASVPTCERDHLKTRRGVPAGDEMNGAQ